MTTETTSERDPDFSALLKATQGHPERAFGVELEERGDIVTGRTRAGVLPLGADGKLAAGALGVLVDDTLGFALVGAARRPSWSVSVEIALDFVGPLTGASGLHATGLATDLDGTAGFAQGEVRDDQGRMLVSARQHGRYVPLPTPDRMAPRLERLLTGSDVLDLLGATVSTEAAATTLTIDDPAPWLNNLETLHGGIGICAAEAAATCATLDGAEALRTTSISAAFGRPMRGDGAFAFVAKTLQAGRTLRVVEVVGSAQGRACIFARIIRQASAGVAR
ncbi:PaaI family thioesterase [Nocardioides sp. NPDC057767]|uniref:PaaI family thioesterase n=1 Tax=unclassified Nocardioides TaxID=2615069 RepID=UPI003672D09D